MVEKSAMGEEVEESLAMNTVHHGDEFETEKGPLAVENVVVLPALRRPLENSWTFWFDNPSAKSKHAAWGGQIRPIYTFSTVEYFWSVYNDIQHPSKLAVGANLHCFKNKIEPKWKDPICVNGGKYVRGKSDASWLYTLLAMIGEQFDYGDEICGAVVNVRSRQEKISIWTKNAANEAALMSIGRQLKEFLDSNEAIGYTLHNHGSGGARNRCCIV